MKWFKHFSQAHSDEKLVRIRVKYGMWGVGSYWTICELVAEQMKVRDPVPVAELGVVELCSLLGCKRDKLVSFLDHLQLLSCWFWKATQKQTKSKPLVIEINIPKLLTIKDNYLSDLEETSKSLPSKEVEGEVEGEGDREKAKAVFLEAESNNQSTGENDAKIRAILGKNFGKKP